ncbi:MAG: methyltransferase type 12, partial [bacterium]
QGHCPALADNDWCHTSLQWVPPPWVNRLSEETGLDRTRIKMSYLVVSKVPATVPHLEGTVARVVSEPLHTKGRLRYIVCGQTGRFPIVMPSSRVSPQTQPMERLPPGTVVEFGPTQPKGDGEDVSKSFVRVLRP